MTHPARTAPVHGRSLALRLSPGLAGLLVVVAGLCAVPSAAFALEIAVHPERTRIAAGDDLRLRVTVEGDVVLQVGSPESEDFRVIQHASSSRSQRVQGRIQHSTEVTMTLRPLRTGQLTVGRIPIRTPRGIHYTEPFTVAVERGDAATAQRGQQQLPPLPRPPVPGRRGATEEDKDRNPLLPPSLPAPESDEMIAGPQPLAERGQPFVMLRSTRDEVTVGEPFLVDFVLFTPTTQIGLEVVDLDDPAFEGFWFHEVTRERLGRRNTRLGSMNIRGELFDAHLIRSYSVVALRPDLGLLPGAGLLIRMRGFFRDQGELHLRSPGMELAVSMPPAAGRPAGASDGNVGRFGVAAEASAARVRPSEPVLLTFRVRGTGMTSRLRLPDAPVAPGLHFGEPRDRTLQDNGLWPSGEAVREWPVRADEAGRYTIPSIGFQYWDPWSQRWQDTGTEPVTIVVEGEAVVVAGEGDDAERPWYEALPPLPSLAELHAPRARPLHRMPWYPFAVALPLLLLVLLRAAPPILARLRAVGATGRADREILTALDGLDPHGAPEAALREVERLLHAAVERRLGRPTRGLTLSALQDLVSSSTSDDLRNAVALLVEVERARFAGQSAEMAPELVAAAREHMPGLMEGEGR